MILSIDAGNTSVTVACMAAHRVLFSFRMATQDAVSMDYCKKALQDHFILWSVDPAAIAGAAIASVVPAAAASLQAAVLTVAGCTPFILRPTVKTGLSVALEDPAQLGADLLAGAVGALHLSPPPLIIVDMGTAITLSVLDRNGVFLGGAIAPGSALLLQALSQGTALLPQAETVKTPPHCIGTDTNSCMQSGAIFGAASMVDGMIDHMEAELGEKAHCIATGGLASALVPLCHHKMRHEPDLLLLGLSLLWEENKA